MAGNSCAQFSVQLTSLNDKRKKKLMITKLNCKNDNSQCNVNVRV